MRNLNALKAELAGMAGRICALDQNRTPDVLPVVLALAQGRDIPEARVRSMLPTQAGPALRSSVNLASGKSGKLTALVSMHGIASYSVDLQPYAFSTRKLASTIRALAADPTIATILIDINTPGGQVTGTPEAASAVAEARRAKPVIGIVNALCASAGYWIASQCTKLISVPSGDVGSIGVFMCHYDCSAMLKDQGIKPTFIFAGEHKVEGNSMEPLGAGAKDFFQGDVDATYSKFVAAVAAGRARS